MWFGCCNGTPRPDRLCHPAHSALLVCVTLLVFVFVRWPCTGSGSYFPLYTRKLNNAVKGNRALLLLLPTDVVDSVKVSVM